MNYGIEGTENEGLGAKRKALRLVGFTNRLRAGPELTERDASLIDRDWVDLDGHLEQQLRAKRHLEQPELIDQLGLVVYHFVLLLFIFQRINK
jgi:hypothetical protein